MRVAFSNEVWMASRVTRTRKNHAPKQPVDGSNSQVPVRISSTPQCANQHAQSADKSISTTKKAFFTLATCSCILPRYRMILRPTSRRFSCTWHAHGSWSNWDKHDIAALWWQTMDDNKYQNMNQIQYLFLFNETGLLRSWQCATNEKVHETSVQFVMYTKCWTCLDSSKRITIWAASAPKSGSWKLSDSNSRTLEQYVRGDETE